MDCPRCGTIIPDEALYCPYCSLPKPKVTQPAEGEPAAAEAGDSEGEPAHPPEPQPAVGSGAVYASATRRRSRRPVHAPSSRRKSKSRKRGRGSLGPGTKRFLLGLGAALLAVGGAGFHTLVMPIINSQGPDSKAALLMLDTLRKMPSKERELTVDARMKKDVDNSRRLGNLRRYQGWHMKPIPGTRNKVMVIFSYEETDKTVHSAEWLADLDDHTFTPQNDLAKAVYGNSIY
jgi:hypothetical protein